PRHMRSMALIILVAGALRQYAGSACNFQVRVCYISSGIKNSDFNPLACVCTYHIFCQLSMGKSPGQGTTSNLIREFLLDFNNSRQLLEALCFLWISLYDN